jgi:hypothetical protein
MSPNVVLVDIDGTVAIRGERGPYEWGRVGEDSPNYAVIKVVLALQSAEYEIVFITGRSEECRNETKEWLSKNVSVPQKLFMREKLDFRPDEIIKKELVVHNFPDTSLILLVIDDRTKVVNMWRHELRLTCLQVGEGNF